ncbi:glycoside hydrolase family 117 protein [Seonamhaeicola maritimus]|uniref:glycoside hydrolase family 117 protein n=1 Tax=Seonamhaeicola maritimus TaxID=2591822 RepID=UPI002494DD43|nr:glycoside hydrolase [Seonamhaeicola maritimus]
MRFKNIFFIGILSGLSLACNKLESSKELKETEVNKVFPHKMPEEKPNFPLSAAAERMFDYPAPRVQDNELFSQFKYTRLEGFDYNGGDGTISRRDPSRPVLIDGKYYMWYTKRHTKVPPVGWNRAHEATDEIPSTDWDLCDLWYATSEDGFKWNEQGVAVKRPEKPALGWRSIATPDILIWEGKYFLYFQAFNEPSGTRGDWCPISMAYADSPDGPWTHVGKPVVPFGKKGEWDQDQTQDPHLIKYKGKIYLYYKAAYNKWPDKRDKYAVAHGLAIADNPMGPFEKHPLNPVLNSGHETTYFPFKEGIAALAIKDGNEAQTIQYAEDGVNFKIASTVELTPTACGFYTPDAFKGTDYGRGVAWGVCHFINAANSRDNKHSIIARVDCDLSLDIHDPSMKSTGVWHRPEVYFKQGLNNKQCERISKENKKLENE